MPIDAARDEALPTGTLWKRLRALRYFSRSRVMVLAIGALALLPVGYILIKAVAASRNVVYWDEFETALALILKLKEGTSPGEFLRDLFALNNEHRMVTSRLMFATSYWLTGTVNFSVISFIPRVTRCSPPIITTAAAFLLW